jgi:crotonobetainyl-CoA:carnitine CoA-transferase CaiB-like acyl-CoA transferase
MGQPSWIDDPRYATFLSRRSHEEEVELLVAQWTVERTAEEVMASLQAAGVCAGLVATAEDLHRDPQLAARRHFTALEHPEIGRSTYDSLGSRLSRTPAELDRAAPILGQDNYHVFTQIFGLSDEEFANLASQGVFD